MEKDLSTYSLKSISSNPGQVQDIYQIKYCFSISFISVCSHSLDYNDLHAKKKSTLPRKKVKKEKPFLNHLKHICLQSAKSSRMRQACRCTQRVFLCTTTKKSQEYFKRCVNLHERKRETGLPVE